jgi:hypothetical protein
MAQLHDIYTFVKITDKLAKKIENTNNRNLTGNGDYSIARPASIDVKGVFKKRQFRKDRSDRKVRLTFGYATSRGYIKEVIKQEDDGHNFAMHRLEIEDPGWKLLDRSLFRIIPKGLWLKWVEENKDYTSIIIAFISGIVLGAISIILAKYNVLK